MPATDEQKALGSLIAQLHSRALRALKDVGREDWRRQLLSSRGDLVSFDLSRSSDKAVEEEVLGIITEDNKCSRFYVVIPEERANKSSWLALARIVVRSNHDGDKSINLELVLLTSTSEPLGIGYRFENPEGKETTHNFYHAQPIRKLKGAGATADEINIPGTPTWYPDTFPSFPIPASDYLDLVLYGAHVACGRQRIEELTRPGGNDLVRDRAARLLEHFG